MPIIDELTRWASEQRLLPLNNFDCRHYKSCQASRNGRPPLDAGNTCMMSYIGPEYGTGPLRLAIVGYDYGTMDEAEKGVADFRCSQRSMLKWYYGTKKNFNPHYCGVVRTAAAIMGEAGAECLSVCWRNKHCAGENRKPNSCCMLRFIAQPNMVKCASGGQKRKCQATPQMFKNCAEHLVSELKLLAPDLIVFHGLQAAKYFPEAVRCRGFGMEPMPTIDSIYKVSWNQEERSHVLFLHHPSYGWLNRTWDRIAEPALEWLRDQRVIAR